MSTSSSSGHLPPSRSKCPTTPLVSMLCLSPITQSVSFCFGLPLLLHSYPHYLSLQRVTSYNVSYPVLLSCSNYIHQRSLFFHLFQFIRASSFVLCCPADLLHPPPYPRLNSQVSIRSTSSLLIVHVSASYTVTLH